LIRSPRHRFDSDRKRALERPFVHSGAACGIDDLPAVHHGNMVAELAGEVEILLNQNNGHFTEPAQIDRRCASISSPSRA
jgi:hypothetical protein